MSNLQIRRVELFKIIANSPEVERVAAQLFKEEFDEQFDKLIEDFENDPISREISEGKSADGTILPQGYGNMFTFIGFQDGSDPIGHVVDILRKYIYYTKGGNEVNRLGIGFRYNIIFDKPGLAQETPFPDEWSPGRSWIFGIEQGISGFANYIYRTRQMNGSRSSYGIQIRHKIESRSNDRFENRSYLSAYFNDFIKRIKQDRKDFLQSVKNETI